MVPVVVACFPSLEPQLLPTPRLVENAAVVPLFRRIMAAAAAVAAAALFVPLVDPPAVQESPPVLY